jgi:hypothetical protein
VRLIAGTTARIKTDGVAGDGPLLARTLEQLKGRPAA